MGVNARTERRAAPPRVTADARHEPAGRDDAPAAEAPGASGWNCGRAGYFFGSAAASRGASHALGGGNDSTGPVTSAPGASGFGTACFTGGSDLR